MGSDRERLLTEALTSAWLAGRRNESVMPEPTAVVLRRLDEAGVADRGRR